MTNSAGWERGRKKKSDSGWFEQNSGQTGHWCRSQQDSATDTDVAVWCVCVCEPASRQVSFKTAAEIPPLCQTADNNVVWKVFLITYCNKTQTAACAMCSAQIESEMFHCITGNDTSATFRRDCWAIFCFVTTRLSDNKRGFKWVISSKTSPCHFLFQIRSLSFFK